MVSLTNEEWRQKWVDKFASGTLSFKNAVATRGRLRGQVTASLNQAREFTAEVEKSIKEGKGVPNTQVNLDITKQFITTIQENVEKLQFFNEKMKYFFSREEKVESNKAWVITEQYCEFYKIPFLKTRENLFKILFFLIDHADKDRILKEVAPAKGNYSSFIPPDGALREVQTGPADATELALVPSDESAFHGFSEEEQEDEDDEEEDGTLDDGMEMNATIVPPGRVWGGAKTKVPIAAAAINSEATALDNTAAFPTSTTGDIFQGQTQTITTSTVRNPLLFNIPHSAPNTDTGFSLFNGPSIFANAMGLGGLGGTEPKNDPRTPWEEIRSGNQQSVPQVPSSGMQQGLPTVQNPMPMQNNANADTTTLLQMFSNSLTSNFAARNIIKDKWDGSPETFEKFAFAWTKCHFQLESLRQSDAVKFSELLTCVTGTARLYIESLPSFLDSSYRVALAKLYEVYACRKTTLKNIVQKLTRMPQCQPTYSSRLQLHATITAYKASLDALKIPPQEALLAFELIFCENAFDNDLKKQWVKYCEKNRDLSKPLGCNVTFQAMSDQVLKCITESYTLSEDNNPFAAKKSHSQGQGGRRWLGNAAAASQAGNSNNPDYVKGQQQQQGQMQQGGKKKPRAKGNNPPGGPPALPPPAQKGAAAAATGAQFRSQPPKNRGDGINKSLFRSGCPFCSKPNAKGGGRGGGNGGDGIKMGNYTQTYAHRFPLGCPLIKLNVLSDQKIREIAKEKRLCSVCLQPGHTSKECQSPDYIRCSVPNCGRRHFRAFHPRDEQKKVRWAAAAAASDRE